MQPDAFADAVVVTVKNALGPVLERLAAVEARQSMLGDVRDRLVLVEAKAAQPVVVPPVDPPPAVDLSPVLERLAAAEARLSVLGDLRDRVVTVETKAAQTIPALVPEPAPPVDLAPVLERVSATEARLDVLGDLRDRVVVIETKAAQPSPPVDVTDVRDRMVALESHLRVIEGRQPVDLAPVLEKCEGLGTEVHALRERIAVAEMRQLVPGPMGHDGRDGQNGRDGKDGLDGLGWDDLALEQVNDRTFTVKCQRGLQVKELGTLTFPVQIYRGVYLEGKSYERGDGVTWGGSEWHCNEPTTTKPGDGSKAWTLKVKRGRDGKDGRDAIPAPVVSIAKR